MFLHVYLWSEFLIISSVLQFNKGSLGRKKSILGLQNTTRKTETEKLILVTFYYLKNKIIQKNILTLHRKVCFAWVWLRSLMGTTRSPVISWLEGYLEGSESRFFYLLLWLVFSLKNKGGNQESLCPPGLKFLTGDGKQITISASCLVPVKGSSSQ